MKRHLLLIASLCIISPHFSDRLAHCKTVLDTQSDLLKSNSTPLKQQQQLDDANAYFNRGNI